MELITVGIIIGLFVCISIVICLTFKLFIQKGHILVLSILIVWFLEVILIRALEQYRYIWNISFYHSFSMFMSINIIFNDVGFCVYNFELRIYFCLYIVYSI